MPIPEPSTELQTPIARTADLEDAATGKSNWIGLLITSVLMVSSMSIVWIFRDEVHAFGMDLLTEYGQNRVDLVLFLITAVSSTPLALPIWGYALAGVSLGYNVWHMAAIMALGAGLGSFVTYGLGRYFTENSFVRSRLPKLEAHPWTEGRSRGLVTIVLFAGAASPIPADLLYAACGFKKFPALLFLVTVTSARFVRYVYLGFGFLYFGDIV